MKRIITTAIALALVAVACGNDTDEALAETEENTTTTGAETTTTTEVEPEEPDVPEGPDEPEEELIPPVLYEGSSDDVIEVDLPTRTANVATVSHSGTSNFAVWELDATFEQTNLMVNTIGAYDGRVLVNRDPIGNLDDDAGTTAFEITADGPWSIEVAVIGHLDLQDLDAASIEGSGDDVVFLLPRVAGPVTLRHEGASNFAIWLHPIAGSTDLLVNEIGAFDGTVPLRAEVGGLLEITADGPWSITPS